MSPNLLHLLMKARLAEFRRSADRNRGEQLSDQSTSTALRIRVALRRGSLARDLAEGAAPSSSPEHALRASQLTSDRNRKLLARSFRRTIEDAHQPARATAPVTIIDRRAVLDAEGAITSLISRLLSPRGVTAEGMARVDRILTRGDASPLYSSSRPAALLRELDVATVALNTTVHE